MSIVSIFRYSAALAEWNQASLAELQTIWALAYKAAWKLPVSVPSLSITAGQRHGGLDVLAAEAIVVLETIGLIKQCTALNDDLHDMIKVDVCRAVLRLEEQSLQGAQKELQWSSKMWESSETVADHFLMCASRSLTIVSDPILEVRAVDNNRQAVLDELARLDKDGRRKSGGWPEISYDASLILSATD